MRGGVDWKFKGKTGRAADRGIAIGKTRRAAAGRDPHFREGPAPHGTARQPASANQTARTAVADPRARPPADRDRGTATPTDSERGTASEVQNSTGACAAVRGSRLTLTSDVCRVCAALRCVHYAATARRGPHRKVQRRYLVSSGALLAERRGSRPRLRCLCGSSQVCRDLPGVHRSSDRVCFPAARPRHDSSWFMEIHPCFVWKSTM